jgi:hypothetical protein
MIMGKAESPVGSGYGVNDGGGAIHPSLQEALNRALKTTQSSWEMMAEAAKAAAPVKSLLEISEQTRKLYLSLDWNNVAKNMMHWSAYSEPVKSLTEIQQAAFKKLSAEHNHMVNSLASSNKALFNAVSHGANVQDAMANCIDKALDAYDTFSNEQKDNTQILADIQAAYLAWYQQTLTGFSRCDS